MPLGVQNQNIIYLLRHGRYKYVRLVARKYTIMKEKFSFYDVKSKSKFESADYEVRLLKNGRYFAVTKSPNGPHECWRVLSKANGERLKDL
ncbi:MAG: hypothetical protein ACJATE_001144 [Bacteroidia bacterium]|jgi:hypothetical protein